MKLEIVVLNFLLQMVLTALLMRPTKELLSLEKTKQIDITKSLNDMMQAVRSMTPTITTTTRTTQSKSYLERIREQIYRIGPTKTRARPSRSISATASPSTRARANPSARVSAKASQKGSARASSTTINKRWRTTVTRPTRKITARNLYECKFVLRNNVPYGSTCYPILDINKMEVLRLATTTSTAAPGADTLPTTTKAMPVHKDCANVAFCKEFKWK